jgi:hypothetical protein
MSADQINELKNQLRVADQMAQAGDAQAKIDAQKIYDRIQELSAQQQPARTAEEKNLAAQELPPELTGAIGAGIGKYGSMGYGGYKAFNVLKNAGALDKAKEISTNVIDRLSGKPIPTTVGEFHTPEMVSEHGFGPGAVRNTQHNIDQKVANALHAELAANPEPGYEVRGNSRILTKEGTYPTTPIGNVSVTGAPATTPAPTAPPSAMSRFGEGAKNVLGTAAKVYNPLMKVLGPVAGGWQAGYEGAEAANRFNRGDVPGGILSTIGAGAGLVSMYPPAAPIMFPISLGASGLGWTLDEYRKRHNKPQTGSIEHAPQYANGGLVYLK